MKRTAEYLKRIEAEDVFGCLGLGLMVFGISRWSIPAAIVLVGFILFAFASGLHTAAWKIIGGLIVRYSIRKS